MFKSIVKMTFGAIITSLFSGYTFAQTPVVPGEDVQKEELICAYAAAKDVSKVKDALEKGASADSNCKGRSVLLTLTWPVTSPIDWSEESISIIKLLLDFGSKPDFVNYSHHQACGRHSCQNWYTKDQISDTNFVHICSSLREDIMDFYLSHYKISKVVLTQALAFVKVTTRGGFGPDGKFPKESHNRMVVKLKAAIDQASF